MATTAKRALAALADTGDEVAEQLADRVSSLRADIAAIAEAVNEFGSHRFHDMQRGATALAREAGHQLPVVARQVGRQATIAGRAVGRDPLPTIVVVGTIALLASLVFRR